VEHAEQAAANESTFREANERLERRADELSPGDGRTPFLCECEDQRCTQVILLTHEEYEAVRAEPRTFALALGHQSPDDRVRRELDGFVVVEKTGAEGELVEERDPRA
jgi:hypothetical protein